MGISQGTGDLRLTPLAGPPVAGVCSGPAVAGICSSGAVKLAAGRDVASANVASVKTLVSIIYLQGESEKSGISKSMYIALRTIRNK